MKCKHDNYICYGELDDKCEANDECDAAESPNLFVFNRYFDDGKELVAQIHEKQKELPEDVGEDFSKAESFHRMHAAFERNITALGKQVQHTG